MPRTKGSLIQLKLVQALPKVLSGTRPAPQNIKLKKFLTQQRLLEREFKKLQKRIEDWKGKERKSKNWGGARPGSGRPQRMPTPWPEELGREMGQPEGFWAFLQNMAREAWIQNVLDARIVGALNSTFRLMADLKGWIEKAPLVIQAQTVVPVDLQELLKHMSRESRFELAKAVRQIEMEHKRD